MNDKPETPPVGQKFTLLRPKPGTCQECGIKHETIMPHNPDSLYYQVKFQQEHGRAPGWDDALAHCSPEIRAMWIEELTQLGAYP